MRDFTPHPLIALGKSKYDPTYHKAWYKFDYIAIEKDIQAGHLDKLKIYKSMILEDLWFIVYFIMEIPDDVIPNHPFVVSMCREVEDGEKTKTLDIWARFHFKSTIITIAETVQYHLKNPNHCSCIFSYKKPLAENFVDAIRKTYENLVLVACFSDILYENPSSQSSSWSLQNGITNNRSVVSRKEKTVEASGLVEGMVQGKHFDRKVFDDCETYDMAMSPDELNKCYSKMDMALTNLGMGTDNDIDRIIGTYYSHMGPMVRIRDKVDIDGEKVYKLRLVSVTDDGSPNGTPVLVSDKKHKELQLSDHYRSQQLCDPTPSEIRSLNSEFLVDIEQEMIPEDLYKFLIIDPAGDQATQTSGTDSWAIMLLGVYPDMSNEIGAAEVYLLNALISPLTESEAIEAIVRMYIFGGIIDKVGVEKVGLSSVESHVSNALAKKGRRISLDEETLVLLRPAGRSKVKRIESALSWPLDNGKLFMSKAVGKAYRDRVRQEMDKFPYWHDDALDAWSYLYDILTDYSTLYQSLKKKLVLGLNKERNSGKNSWLGI